MGRTPRVHAMLQDDYFMWTNYANAGTFHGCLRNLRVYGAAGTA